MPCDSLAVQTLQMEPVAATELLKSKTGLEALRNGIVQRLKVEARGDIYQREGYAQISFDKFTVTLQNGRIDVRGSRYDTNQAELERVSKVVEELAKGLAGYALSERLVQTLKSTFGATEVRQPNNFRKLNLTVRI